MTDAEARLWRALRRGLSEKNIAVVRYWNNDVFSNLQGVLADLIAAIEKRVREVTPSPALPLSGGGSTSRPRGAA
jgi:hypothetical protein